MLVELRVEGWEQPLWVGRYLEINGVLYLVRSSIFVRDEPRLREGRFGLNTDPYNWTGQIITLKEAPNAN